MGPYAFKQFYQRANTTFSGEEEEVVDFNKLKHWEFDPERSEGSLSDEIWSVNMILLSIAEAVRYSKKKMENLCEQFCKRWPNAWSEDDYPFLQYLLGESFSQAGEKLFMKYKVANLTFDGVDSPLFHMGDIDGNIGAILDSRFPYGKFGWFYGVMIAITILHSSCFPSEKRL